MVPSFARLTRIGQRSRQGLHNSVPTRFSSQWRAENARQRERIDSPVGKNFPTLARTCGHVPHLINVLQFPVPAQKSSTFSPILSIEINRNGNRNRISCPRNQAARRRTQDQQGTAPCRRPWCPKTARVSVIFAAYLQEPSIMQYFSAYKLNATVDDVDARGLGRLLLFLLGLLRR